jgi:hypothetical protein
VRLGYVHHLQFGHDDAVDGLPRCCLDQLLVRLCRGHDHDPAEGADDHRIKPDGGLRRSGTCDHAGV